MKNKGIFFGLFLIIILGALLFRIGRLDLRPMHHDEANQAVKFGELLERGDYKYDRDDHHGPSLYYLTLPFAWISSGSDFAEVNEVILRLVPALFGVGVLLLLLLLKSSSNGSALIFAALLFAVSPVMVFYSRFYIQEMLLVFFLVGIMAAGWRYFQSRSVGWALASGFFAGMMFATKETCVIAFCAIFGSLVLNWRISHSLFEINKNKPSLRASLIHISVFFAAAVGVSFLLYSSFFKNLNGPLDSILAYGNYLNRAADAGIHTHPWYYYLKMLVFSQYGNGPVWSEILVLILAVVGGGAALFNRKQESRNKLFFRFILFYTLLATIIYSIISYKTPWNMLPFYFGFLVLAGYGVAFFMGLSRRLWIKGVVFLILAIGIFHLGVQSSRACFRYNADPRNPYVYAHTSTDFLNLVKRVNELYPLHPAGREMLIFVVASPYETWPLPWYLRGFPRVGYWQEVDISLPWKQAGIIISSTDNLDKLMVLLDEEYLSEFYGLRPDVLMALHIKKDLWAKFLKEKAKM